MTGSEGAASKAAVLGESQADEGNAVTTAAPQSTAAPDSQIVVM